MSKSFSFIACIAIVVLAVAGFVAGAYHLLPYGILLKIASCLLVAMGIVFSIMAQRARRARNSEAFVLLDIVGFADLCALIMLVPIPGAEFPELMMAATMAMSTAMVLMIHGERLHWRTACCKA